jgi:pyruvate/2-oxoglutarate dehydrogenase complex dihydrolipoamide acyltransferase (E2) component
MVDQASEAAKEAGTMNSLQQRGRVMPYPKLRRVLEIMYPSAQRKPMIHALLEIDVTAARTFLREHRAKTGESLSFTAFVLSCLAQALDGDKSLQACRKGRRHLFVFDEVDVALPIEREVAGQMQPIIFIVRAANTKTFREIHEEIRSAQVGQVSRVWEGFAAGSWLQSLPMPLIRAGWKIFCWMRQAFPQIQKKYGGTVGLTAVGMFGRGSGWGIPLNDHTLDLTLGGIAVKPGVVDGHIRLREYLSVTLSFNHALIDGAPAARFARRLQDLVESGYGLDVSEPTSQDLRPAQPAVVPDKR